MKDVQNEKDTRNIYLHQVGIRDLKYPVVIRNGEGETFPVTAQISLSADLEPQQKGTHMSRFVEVLTQYNQMDLPTIRQLLEAIRERLEARNSFCRFQFDYYIWKKSPVTGRESYLALEVEYKGALRDDELDFHMTVRTPVTTLCPCSKEISDYSAHNQRAIVSITIRTNQYIWIEDVSRVAEAAASCPVYSLLKRPDEKYVTEYAYDHPKFVEDVARDAKLLIDGMEEMEGVESYVIEVESLESIHNHSAYAKVEGFRV
ncbi:MAG: GTP cyclohydrolase I FolE2 [Firmicutes bacterium]|nr:GTP cyclohydrolase I FolE2 [Bacillota bacterium]